MRIEILVFAGVDELDALGPFEVLRNAQAFGAQFNTRLVIADLAGAEIDWKVARSMEYERQGSVWTQAERVA